MHMGKILFNVSAPPLVPIVDSDDLFPINRIFCVGRNYEDHAKEMGAVVDREAPIYFTKPASAIVLSGGAIPYPPGTKNFHYEMELVVGLDKPAFKVDIDQAMACVFGYACGLDMTRRDLQQHAKDNRYPWDIAKSFENSAIISPLTPVDKFGAVKDQRIWLKRNNEIKQDSHLSAQIWSVAEIISHLSHFYHLDAGDLIYTGTPAGVGGVQVGDVLTGGIDGLSPLMIKINDAQ